MIANLEEALATLDRGETVDFVYQNDLVYSRKEAYLVWYGTDPNPCFCVWHAIDDTTTYFTREGIIDVLLDKRSAWDGDYHPKEERCETPYSTSG